MRKLLKLHCQKIDPIISSNKSIYCIYKLLRLLSMPLFLFFILNKVNCQASPERLGNHILNTGVGLIFNGKFGEVDLLYEYVGLSIKKSSFGLQTGVGISSKINGYSSPFPFFQIGVGYNYKIMPNRELNFDFITLISEDSYAPEFDFSYGFINLRNKRRIKISAKINLSREAKSVSPIQSSLTPVRPFFGVGIRLGRYFGK